jgi:hypothetical protein
MKREGKYFLFTFHFLLFTWRLCAFAPLREPVFTRTTRNQQSMPEMPHTGKHHRDTMLVSGSNRLVIAH